MTQEYENFRPCDVSRVLCITGCPESHALPAPATIIPCLFLTGTVLKKTEALKTSGLSLETALPYVGDGGKRSDYPKIHGCSKPSNVYSTSSFWFTCKKLGR